MGNYLRQLRVAPPSEAEQRSHPLYYDWSVPKWTPFRLAEEAGGSSGPTATALATAAATPPRPTATSHASDDGAAAAAAQPIGAGRPQSFGNHEAQKRNSKPNSGANKTRPQSHPNRTGGNNNNNMPAATTAAPGQRSESSMAKAGRVASGVKSPSSLAGGAKAQAKEPLQNSLKATLTSTVDTGATRPANLPAAAGGRTGLVAKTTAGALVRGADNGARAGEKSAATTTVKRVDLMRPQTIEPAKYGGVEDQAAIKAATSIHTIAPGGGSKSLKSARAARND